tara:strand:- start:3916 stop:4164 length:249 start_codon:yes stop_codon:yes gene_type:complete
MFQDRSRINNPTIVIRKNLPNDDFQFVTEKRVGTYYLVIPKTAKEIFYIQMLVKNVEVMIPFEGDGLILSCKVVDRFFVSPD